MHTTGKWKYLLHANYEDGTHVYDIKPVHETFGYAPIARVKGDKRSTIRQSEANAARIVQCVNGWDDLKQSHDELVAALEVVCTQYELFRNADSGFDGIPSRAITSARVVIAKAKEVTK